MDDDRLVWFECEHCDGIWSEPPQQVVARRKSARETS
jgi:hypothetical protein